MALFSPQRLVTLPDGRVADPSYVLVNSAGYAPNIYNPVDYPPVIPWFYRNSYNPGAVSSYVAPTTYSYLPPFITIHH